MTDGAAPPSLRRRRIAIAGGAFAVLIALVIWFGPPRRHRGADLWWCAATHEFRESVDGPSLEVDSDAFLLSVNGSTAAPVHRGAVELSDSRRTILIAWPTTTLQRWHDAVFGRSGYPKYESMAITDDKVDAGGMTWARCERVSWDPLGRR